MGWWIFFTIFYIIALILVPLKEWKRYILAGILGLFVILAIDSALVSLGAIRFSFDGISVLGLPLPYWLSYLPGGIIFARFRPVERVKRLLYIFAMAPSYMFVEFLTIKLGMFHHLNWNLLNALILNIGGFTIQLWFTEWIYSK